MFEFCMFGTCIYQHKIYIELVILVEDLFLVKRVYLETKMYSGVFCGPLSSNLTGLH